MCNIAGYVGNRDAAPILIEMMRREEGFAGGYYTGLATLDCGVIHHRKLTGNLSDLLAKTDSESLPGKIGIIHSRSKSGGGDAFAHPFCNFRDNEATLAYVANGGANHSPTALTNARKSQLRSGATDTPSPRCRTKKSPATRSFPTARPSI